MVVPQLKFFRAFWGAEAEFSTDIDVLFAEIHRLGYTGVEITLSDIHRISSNDPDAFSRALQNSQLELIGQVQTNYPTVKDGVWQDLPVDEHVANLEIHFKEFMQYKPVHVNIQGGQDSWSIEENEQFFEKALEVQARYSQVTSSHEVSIMSFPLKNVTSFFSSKLMFLDPSHSFTLQSVHHCSYRQTFSNSTFNGRLFTLYDRL
jgi:sugar phosphate isomerase/epimerase